MILKYLIDQFEIAESASIPLDVRRLANRFWNNNIELETKNFPIWSIKKGDLKPFHLRDQSYYYLLKVIFISKPKLSDLQVKNVYSWLFKSIEEPQDLESFLKNDGRSIKNADGTFIYNDPGENAAIFGIKTNSNIENFGSLENLSNDSEIKAILYQGQLVDKFDNYSAFDETSKNDIHAYIYFAANYNFVQRVLLSPFGNLLIRLFPKLKNVAGGPSSPGVRIPPRRDN